MFSTVSILVLKQHKINPSVMRTYPNHHERQTLLNHDSLIKLNFWLDSSKKKQKKCHKELLPL